MIHFLTIHKNVVYVYRLAGHFLRYILLVLSWTPVCPQNCPNSSWHTCSRL